MKELTAETLLDLWERGIDRLPAERGLLLLEATDPQMASADRTLLTIGQRDARLFDLREAIFGSHYTSVGTCPSCGERVELEFDRTQFATASPAVINTVSVRVNDQVLQFRLPNTADLLDTVEVDETEEVGSRILRRCLVSEMDDDSALVPPDFTDDVVKTVSEAMSEADPAADIRVNCECPACGHTWETPFDIVLYLWNELNVWAIRTLEAVHRLACAYSWSERDILAMSPNRRQAYLDLLG